MHFMWQFKTANYGQQERRTASRNIRAGGHRRNGRASGEVADKVIPY